METTAEKGAAIITGGGRGIGLSIARHLKEAGYPVVITGRSEETLHTAAESLGGDVMTCRGDSSSENDFRTIVKDVLAEFPKIDVLVNNAGISGEPAPFLESSIADIWKVQEVNLLGPMIFMRAILPGMVERGNGTVFNIGSYGAIYNIPGVIPYGVSKAALARVTDSLALELENTGVNLFCLSPGLVLTDMTRDAAFTKDIPADAYSQPEDIAHLILKLLSADVSALSGRFLHVKDDIDKVLSSTDEIQKKGLYKLGLENLEGRLL